MKRSLLVAVGVATLSAATLFAVSYVVPPDRDFILSAPAIAVGSPLESHTELNAERGIETVTTLSIEETIKGSIDGDTIEIYEPGGVYKNRAAIFPGTPRFEPGERDLLFLTKSDDGHWHVLDLGLGRFQFVTDSLGHDLLVRDLHDSVLFSPKGGRYRDMNRAADPFLNFVRATVNGGPARQDYGIPAEPLLAPPVLQNPMHGHLKAEPTACTYPSCSATSYTYSFDGTESGIGGRWCGSVVGGTCTVAFPTAVNFGSVNGSACSGCNVATAIGDAFAAWDGAAGASVDYAYSGNDPSGTANSPSGPPDGKNTIAFEYDLSTCCGIQPFQCSGSGYSGVLGEGGISNTSGTHSGPNGETFDTAIEGDVWMNKGISGCTLLISGGDLNSAVTHEVGHTLGFRHADQTRADNPSIACSTDPSLECVTYDSGTNSCSPKAIMCSFVSQGLNATLQTYDLHAVDAVYPGTGAPAAPTGVVATATTSNNVQVTWSGSCVTTCHIYRSADHIHYTEVGSSVTSPFNDSSAAANTSYLYKVRAFNGVTESGDSNSDIATTVIYVDDPLVPGSTIIKSVHLTQLRTAVNAIRILAGLGAATFTYSGAAGTVVHATDINELRSDLDAAAPAVGLPTGVWTDNPLVAGSTVIKAVHFQELRNRMK